MLQLFNDISKYDKINCQIG
uniref:Uncharacterized protein n=1 Tax=Arundo donax TaxID=35708 RepID=A0A0A9BJJ2_ARUDO